MFENENFLVLSFLFIHSFFVVQNSEKYPKHFGILLLLIGINYLNRSDYLKEIKKFYSIKMKADEIEKIVHELLSLKDTYPKSKLDDMFLDFRTANRMLYETILEGQFQPEIFKEMMKLKRKLENGEDQYSVDVKFGEYMAEKYINPVVKPVTKK